MDLVATIRQLLRYLIYRPGAPVPAVTIDHRKRNFHRVLLASFLAVLFLPSKDQFFCPRSGFRVVVGLRAADSIFLAGFAPDFARKDAPVKQPDLKGVCVDRQIAIAAESNFKRRRSEETPACLSQTRVVQIG
jgi:hypothetical protein